MKLQPIETYGEPEYPTQESLRQKPEFLRAAPKRWLGNRAALSALAGALALMNQSCASRTHIISRTVGVPAPPQPGITEEEARPPSKPGWGRTMGKIAVPRSAVPEDEAKAEQEASTQQSSQR